ncbi:MAG TPA: FxsA family protein [Chromatiaceae bacterium]|jgi:UPF0716 protein FxsA|nr:FxsA family protein [Chromatiaceae bacterium]HIN82715.1 FxsA family protein [Chromatiales bacterium]HIO15049.1 FxsA family protein [Chromatiales bacterium]
MSTGQKLFLLFIGVPLVEMYLLIEVGSHIGGIFTIALVVFTAVLGAQLVRLQGFSAMQKLQLELAEGRMPAEAMLEGMALLVAGLLLLTPGFMTDAVGFLLLTPSIRRVALSKIIANVVVASDVSGSSSPPGDEQGGQGRTLEGEFWRDDSGDKKQ